MDLRQSTAVVIEFGPFLDKADGLALLSGLVSAIDHATTGIKLSKNGGTLAVRHATVTASSYDAHGCYKVTLDTTDTATLGTLRVIYTDPTTCLPVWQDFMVLTANAWDSTYGAAVMACNTTQVGGTAQTARDLGAGVLVTVGQLAVKKNVVLPSFLFPMFDVTGALKTGLSVTVAIRLDSAAFHNTSASATEIGSTGWYTVDLGTADTNGNVIAFSATATGAVPTCMTIVTQA